MLLYVKGCGGREFPALAPIIGWNDIDEVRADSCCV